MLSLQNLQNHLDVSVFPSPKDWKSFEYLLDTLDHITIEKLTRLEYIAKGANIYEIFQKEDVSYGRLSMPEDVTHGELLFFIDFLTQKFGIEAYSQLDDILTKVKILIGICLRENELSSQGLQELAAKYHLDDGFIQRIVDHRLRPDSSARSFVRELRGGRLGRVAGVVHIEAGSQKLAQALKQEFSFNFLRRGLEIVRMGMKTMTQEEQELLAHQDGSIEIHVSNQDLDKIERLLRKKIKIDELKQELILARNAKNSNEVEKIEKKALDIINEVIYEYPYQLTGKKHGYQLSRMIETKELFCVGTALLGHAFLSELQIRHKGVEEAGHARLNVYIGQGIYKFDPSLHKSVLCIGYNSGTVHTRRSDSISGDTELMSLAQTMNSKGFEFLASGKRLAGESKYNESISLLDNAIQMFDMALEFCPEYIDAYYNKGITLIKKFLGMKHMGMKIPEGEYDEAIRIFQQIDSNNPHYKQIDVNKDQLLQLGLYMNNLISEKADPIPYEPLLAEGDSFFSDGKYGEAYSKYDEVIHICSENPIITPKDLPQRTKRETQEKKIIAINSIAYILREEGNISEADKYTQMARSIGY